MSITRTIALLSGLAFLSKVYAHGIVSGIVADGVYYQGYDPSFQYQNPPPIVAGWSIPQDQDRGFISDYTSPDIDCHIGATPGGAYVKVAAGDNIQLQWTPWPSSHHGPMLDYLAHCANDDCTSVDKTTLKFNKIDQVGLVSGSNPGTWGSDQMIANNNTWVTTIPSSIAPGKYVLRHETIALHSAGQLGGAQNYPQCMNLEVTGSGSDSLPGGTVGTSLYTATDPGILINIYQALSSYQIPGPALYSGAGSSGSSAPSSKPASSVAASSGASSTGSIIVTAQPTTGVAIPTSSPAGSSPSGASTSSVPISFTETYTGRTGAPTTFVCYSE